MPVQVVDRGDPARDRLGILLRGVDARHRHDLVRVKVRVRVEVRVKVG